LTVYILHTASNIYCYQAEKSNILTEETLYLVKGPTGWKEGGGGGGGYIIKNFMSGCTLMNIPVIFAESRNKFRITS